MPLRRLLLFSFALALLGAFLWAVVAINRESEISCFTTDLEGRTQDQINNLHLAAARIDGFILKPGEVFSFNTVVGERLRQWGYRGAPALYHGTVVSSPGGGLCQLSSTLYNAALLAGLESIERYPHLWTINSVGPGRDATVLYDKLDLKFKNNYDFPIKIKVDINSSYMVVRMFAPERLKEDISIEVQVLQVYPAPRYPNISHDTPDPEAVKVKSAGKEGYTVKVFRLFQKDGKVVRKELISRDHYEPVPGQL